MAFEEGKQASEDGQMLTAVAEQLRLLLLQVARGSELALEHCEPELLRGLQDSSQIGLRLVDHYLLGLKFYDGQQEFLLEPVSLSALLSEAAHELYPLARRYGTNLDVHIAGKFPPVMAHREALKAALVSMGYGMIMGQIGGSDSRKPHLQLTVHRTPRGIVSGIYGDTLLNETDWRRGRRLQGKARQPITALAPAAGAGIFVSDTLFSAMGTTLRTSKFAGQRGLVGTFQVSQQLALVEL